MWAPLCGTSGLIASNSGTSLTFLGNTGNGQLSREQALSLGMKGIFRRMPEAGGSVLKVELLS